MFDVVLLERSTNSLVCFLNLTIKCLNAIHFRAQTYNQKNITHYGWWVWMIPLTDKFKYTSILKLWFEPSWSHVVFSTVEVMIGGEIGEFHHRITTENIPGVGCTPSLLHYLITKTKRERKERENESGGMSTYYYLSVSVKRSLVLASIPVSPNRRSMCP